MSHRTLEDKRLSLPKGNGLNTEHMKCTLVLLNVAVWDSHDVVYVIADACSLWVGLTVTNRTVSMTTITLPSAVAMSSVSPWIQNGVSIAVVYPAGIYPNGMWFLFLFFLFKNLKSLRSDQNKMKHFRTLEFFSNFPILVVEGFGEG